MYIYSADMRDFEKLDSLGGFIDKRWILPANTPKKPFLKKLHIQFAKHRWNRKWFA